MNIDEKIKKELEQEALEIDKILAQEGTGLFSMIVNSFKGNMKRWFIIANAVTILATVGLLYCGYHFFTVVQEQQHFWGILFVISLQAQIALKQWIFSEINRTSTIREIKRLELSVNELTEKLSLNK